MSKEINEVTGILRLFTSPNRGMKPAEGIIRAVTIITSEEYATTIKITTTNPNHILLHTDPSFDYYKVKVAPGTRMEHRATAICAEAGMKAVCSGPSSCYNHNNGGKCVHTPLEDVNNAQCGYPMSVGCLPLKSQNNSRILFRRGLGLVLCPSKATKQCAQLDRLFSDMPVGKTGDCGIVEGYYCSWWGNLMTSPNVSYES